MQATLSREYLVHYQYWMSYRNCYETDTVVVEANSVDAARKVAMDEMGILEILSIKQEEPNIAWVDNKSAD
jgi:hypothetical protein